VSLERSRRGGAAKQVLVGRITRGRAAERALLMGADVL
jgi:hypothetical protein